MPFFMRILASSTKSLMPGTRLSAERVAISPNTHGTLTSYLVVWVLRSGMPKTVNDAGAGSVFHIASIAAIFIFWFKPAV